MGPVFLPLDDPAFGFFGNEKSQMSTMTGVHILDNRVAFFLRDAALSKSVNKTGKFLDHP